MPPPASAASSLLLVEGNDDEHVIRHLCERERITVQFEINRKNGLDALLKAIPNHLATQGLTMLGIVVDADACPHDKWRAIANRLRTAGIAAPVAADPSGTVVPGDIRVGVWIMPDNRKPGEIEDFVSLMIPAGDPVWPRAERYIDDIPEAHRRFNPNTSTRAKVHAWLAAQERPRPMGLGITSGDLSPDGPNAQAFLGWIKRLFGPTPPS